MIRYVILYIGVLVLFGIIFKFPFGELMSKLGIKKCKKTGDGDKFSGGFNLFEKLYTFLKSKNSPANPTLFDVRDCLLSGKRDMAIKLYQQIYQTSLLDAQKAIEELERNIGKKNP